MLALILSPTYERAHKWAKETLDELDYMMMLHRPLCDWRFVREERDIRGYDPERRDIAMVNLCGPGDLADNDYVAIEWIGRGGRLLSPEEFVWEIPTFLLRAQLTQARPPAA